MYQPDPGKARDLINVEAVLAQAVPHEGRDEVMPPRDRIPPLF
jgi:hypothetical protein